MCAVTLLTGPDPKCVHLSGHPCSDVPYLFECVHASDLRVDLLHLLLVEPLGHLGQDRILI